MLRGEIQVELLRPDASDRPAHNAVWLRLAGVEDGTRANDRGRVMTAARILEQEQAIYIEIGRRINEEREMLGFSQAELAKEVDLTRTSITNIEQGRQHLPIHMLYRIATALGIPIEFLVPRYFPTYQECQEESA